MPAGSARNAEGEQEVISQIPIPARRRAFAAALLAALTIIAAPTVALAQQVVALVDGEPITSLDIEHRAKFIQMSTQKAPARQEVLDGLIDEILEIKEAHRYGIDAPASEVDNAFANVASRMGIDTQKLTQVLASNGSSADTLKHRLRAELAWTNLVRGRYKASLEIRDSDVEAELQLHKPDDKSADVGYEYVMRPIVLVVQHGAPEFCLRSTQAGCRRPARTFSELQRRHCICSRAQGSRRSRSGDETFRRPAARAARHSGRHGGRPPDAAGADRRRGANVRVVLEARNKVGHAGQTENSRRDVPAKIRGAGKALSGANPARRDDRI